MRVPSDPPIGHLVAYEYLWHSKAKNREDGEKVYPTALLLSKADEFGFTVVYALGISHMPPTATRRALEVPPKLRRHIGLDAKPQWIYTDEINVFVWPGPDLRPAHWISQHEFVGDTCVIGKLPENWYEDVKQHFFESYQMKLVRIVKRS